jgi:hypothetical protein
LLLVSDWVDALGKLVSSGIKAGGGSVVASLVSGDSLRLKFDVGSNEIQELLSGVVSEGVSLRLVGFPTLSLSLDISNDSGVNGV